MRLPALVGLLALGAGTGCIKHVHLEHNAPGEVDVTRPPSRKTRRVEDPKDPGERMLALSGGGFAGTGLAALGPQNSARWGYGLGLEGSVSYGSPSQRRSHSEDDLRIFPTPAYALNAGWTVLSREGTGLGPLYGEFQYGSEALSLAGGYAWDVNDRAHGPQLTASFGPFYLRTSYLFSRRLEVNLGLIAKGALVWVWSR